MDLEELSKHIESVVNDMMNLERAVDEDLKRLEIALTGTLRLLSGEASTLKGLQGDPEALKGYILREVSTVRSMTREKLDRLIDSMKSLQEDLRNQ